MGLNNRNVIASFLLLFTGGATFFLYPNWLILPVTAFSWFLLEVHFVSNPRMGRITHALILGLFLLAFDFIFENIGASYGFWVTKRSYLFVFAVPFEVMLTCLFGGASFSILMSSLRWSPKTIFFSLILWAIGGTVSEFYLRLVNLMEYGNGWLSFPHAFISYIVTFIILLGIIKEIDRRTYAHV
jgi:hypothetical protein